jgi:hypothetical protein
MAKKTIGKCFICKKEVTKHDVTFIDEGEKYPDVLYHDKLPGDHFVCAVHPGAIELYNELKERK